MDIEIQRGTLDDLGLLMEWRMRVLHEVFSIPPDDAMTELERENRAYYQAALPTERHIACFANVDSQIVGCGGVCIYQEMPSPDNPSGRYAYLMNIYTLPVFRGQGVGGAVVRWLIGQAEQRGITKIYLETSESGRPLYQKLSFTDMGGYMYHRKTK